MYQQSSGLCMKCRKAQYVYFLTSEGPWALKSNEAKCSACGADHVLRLTVDNDGAHVHTRLAVPMKGSAPPATPTGSGGSSGL